MMTMEKQQAWSYSSLDAFETCPYRWKLTKLIKTVQDPPNAAGLWGNRVHKGLEDYIKTRTPLPEDVKQFQPMVDSVIARAKGKQLHAEQKICLDRNFSPVSWFDKKAWVRGITDFTIEGSERLFIGDWKTGKQIPNSSQLRLTAAMAFATKSWIQEVTTAFVWIKTGKVDKEVIEREEAPDIWQEFLPRVKRLQDAIDQDKFPKRPSGLCANYCPVGKANCEHCGKP